MRRLLELVCIALVIGCGSANNADVDASGEPTCSCAGGELCVAGQCVPGNCADGTQSGNETDIDCGGDCLACTEGQLCLGALDCSSKFCTAEGACTDCKTEGDCTGAPGTYCDSGVCRGRNALGNQCASENECSSGYCVDGVCCDGPCDGSCELCGASGVCDFVGAGESSSGDCTPSEVGTCGLSGECDGGGGCAFLGTDVACDLATCGGSDQGICDGAGSCDPNGAISCDPYVCSGDGVNCLTTCSVDEDCVPSHYCTGPGGTCAIRLAQGADCINQNECLSKLCVDGKCCNNSCEGTCESCSTGLCTDIDGASAADCGSADPPCGNTGVCNGAGACEQYGAGTPCEPQDCSNGQQTSARTCDGSGVCSPGGLTSCAPYECDGDTCRMDCTDDIHCQSGFGCVGDECVVQKTNGTLCGAGSECASGFCVEGRCCNSGCTGECRSCLASKTDAANGTCANISEGDDPDDECPDDGTACGRTGACSGSSTGCAYVASGTPGCAATTCQTGFSHKSTSYRCNGSGACSGTTITCSNHLTCNATGDNTCSTTCNVGGCSEPADWKCEGGSCVPTGN